MKIQNCVLNDRVSLITFAGEPVERSKFINPDGEYFKESYETSLSQIGIELIGKKINEFDLLIPKIGWFKCVC